MNEEDIKIDTTQEDVTVDVTDEEQEAFIKDTEENTIDCTNDDELGDVND